MSPASGSKLYDGQAREVRVTVTAGAAALRQWSLRLLDANGQQLVELGRGAEAAEDLAVAELRAEDLEVGEWYELHLWAEDDQGTSSEERMPFLAPDLQYSLIPLRSGQVEGTNFGAGDSVDESGDLVAFGGSPVAGVGREVLILNAISGQVRGVAVPLSASPGFQLTKDGQRLFFPGRFPVPGGGRSFDVGFLDLTSGALESVGPRGSQFFGIDRSGSLLAFQSHLDLDPLAGNPDRAAQFFLYDEQSGVIRQLTTGPGAIDFDAGCPPSITGTTPVVSAGGARVAFASTATLGLAPADTAVGCRVFVYEVATGELRHVVSFPTDVAFDLPTISDDGRWLSYTTTRFLPPDIISSFPALLDLDTGEITDPIGGVEDYPGFDSVISGNATKIVISSQADLDPSVGNADHNMELFVYDRGSDTFTQASDTVGGIGRTPGNCSPLFPKVSRDARVMTAVMPRFFVPPCEIDGPQRDGRTGLALEQVRAVRRRPGNTAPTLSPPIDIAAEAGARLLASFTATDPDADPLFYFLQEVGGNDIPLGSEFEDHHDGTATFTWSTGPEDAGVYALRLAVFDGGGGVAMHDFTVAVCTRMVDVSTIRGLIAALFDPPLAAECGNADVNGDGRVSVADVVARLSWR